MTNKQKIKFNDTIFYSHGSIDKAGYISKNEREELKRVEKNELTNEDYNGIIRMLVNEFEQLKNLTLPKYYSPEVNEYSGFDEGCTLEEHHPRGEQISNLLDANLDVKLSEEQINNLVASENRRSIKNKLCFNIWAMTLDKYVDYFMVVFEKNNKLNYEIRVSTDGGTERLSSGPINNIEDIKKFVFASSKYLIVSKNVELGEILEK